MAEQKRNNDAAPKEWKALYEAGNEIFKLKPWETFKETDIIALGDTYETAQYVLINSQGISIYDGVSGLNDFFLLRMADSLGLDGESAMYEQSCLTCYWGGVDELSHTQKKRIRDMGFNYGENEWLYFVSFAAGFYPAEPDRDEILRLTEALKILTEAVAEYRERGLNVSFDEGLMYVYSSERNVCDGKPWPFAGYVSNELIAPDEFIEDAVKCEKNGKVLEIDMQLAGAEIDDPAYMRPVNPRLLIAAESNSGEILLNKVSAPGEKYGLVIAEFLTEYILENGRPKRIKISNGLLEFVLKDVCQRCDIDLRQVRLLPAIDAYARRVTALLKNVDENRRLI